ncbi:unnamed protein product [Staurois parvus]|uniref:Uncharacterized protein n=1 Tax=Staurois parvus TaxID=386267 RepID=A0ABN9CR81_9NEOB|nr:unnamed protein product [Staurois parvus]
MGRMDLDEVVYLYLLVFDDREYAYQTLKEYPRDELLECIRLAHVLVDQGTEFSEVQPLIQVCAELVSSGTPECRDEFLPPFSADQVESLVWLLEDDVDCFLDHYAACSPQTLRDCINAVQSLVRQALCKLSFVQPILQTWTDLLHPASVSLQKPSPASNLFPQSSIPAFPTAPPALLSTACQYPVPTRCTYPAFNPVKKPSVATAPSSVPSSSSSLSPAAPFVCRPAFTCSAPVVKNQKKAKILSNQYHPASIQTGEPAI